MATLGALTLKLRSTRLILLQDLQIAEATAQASADRMNAALQLKVGANIDWDSLSRTESEVRRWADSLPQTDLQIRARIVGADLYGNLQDLKSALSAPLKIEVDDQRLFELNQHFDLKESHYKRLQGIFRDSPLRVGTDLSTLRAAEIELDRVAGKFSNRRISLGVEQPERRPTRPNLENQEVGKSIEKSIDRGLSKSGISKSVGAIASPINSIARGAFEGLGRDLFSNFSKSFSQSINEGLANTIGSTDLVGRKLGQAGVKKFQQIGYQLAAENPALGATSAAIQAEIRAALGEKDVAIEANRIRGKAQKQKRQDLAIAREGVTEERKAAREEVRQAEADAIKTYRDVKPLQDEIDRRDAPNRQKLAKIAGLRADYANLSPEKQARLKAIEARIEQRREKLQPAQDLIDSRLEAAAARLAIANDRSASADAQARLLKRQQQPKLYQDILDEVAPNLPENLVPKLVANPNAKAEGEYGRYNVVENQIYLDPAIHAKLQSGKRLSEVEYKTVREEIEHAKDLQFGQFAGYQSLSERRLIGKPVKATSQEEAAVAKELVGYADDVKPFERNAKIKTNRAYSEYARSQQLAGINDYVGAGGRKFSKLALGQFKSAEAGLSTAREVATAKGIDLPALGKLETGVKNLKLEHLRLVEEIQAAQAGDLTPQAIAKLESDLVAHTNKIVSTRQRINNAGKAVVKVANRQPQQSSFEANRGSWDGILGELDTLLNSELGQKAKQAGNSLVRAGDRALVPQVNKLLSQVPGQPGVIDYGAGVDSLSQLTAGDYGKIARLGLQGSAGAIQKTGSFLQGVENVALGLLPGGKTAKKLIQQTALPAAAFGAATHLLPGGEIVSHALQGGLQGMMSLPGAGIEAGLGSLVGNTIGQLPMLGPSVGAATNALVAGGVDMAANAGAGILAPILGGKFLLNAGQATFNAIAPAQTPSNAKLLAAGEQVAQKAVELPVQVKTASAEFARSTNEQLKAIGSKIIQTSIEPLALSGSNEPRALNPSQPKFLPAKPATESPATTNAIINIEAKRIGSDDAIEYARKIQQATKIGKQKLQEALKAKDTATAAQIAGLLRQHLTNAQTELDEIRKALGSDAAIGNEAGDKLAQTKGVVTRTLNDLNRQIKVKNLPVPELESLQKKRKYDPKTDPLSAGMDSIASLEANLNRFDRAEEKVQQRESNNLKFANTFGGGSGTYDPLQNAVNMATAGAKTKLGELKEVGAKVLSVFAGFAGLGFVATMISRWGSAAFETANQLESLQNSMNAVSSSSVRAQSLVARSMSESNQLGYNALAGLQGDNSFYAATKDTAIETVAPDLMTGLKQYNRVLGVSEDRSRLAQMAIQQMAGKGQLYAEEVFGQLAESSPGAANVLARSQGLTIGQLRKQMQEGGLNSNDVLPRLGNQFYTESIGGAEAASKSGAASVGRFQNSIQSLQANAGKELMAPTIAGLEVATAATNALGNNIDIVGKGLGAAFLSAAASVLSFQAGLGLASPALGLLVRGLTTALPLLGTFALQAGVAYAAIELFSTIVNSINDNSPFKSLADESEAAFARITQGASTTQKSLADLRTEIYNKDRNLFQVVGDGISGAFGGQTSATKKEADNTVNVDRLLDQNEAALKRSNPRLSEASRQRRDEIDLELSVIRSENAKLTSKDRDKIDANQKQEQKLIEERSKLEKPINLRQAEIGQIIKNANNVIDSPLSTDTAKASAKAQLAEAEKEQRKLQETLISSASILTVGLRKIAESAQAGIAAIELASTERRTRSYLTTFTDPRNVGGKVRADYLDTQTDLSGKQQIQQQAVSQLKAAIYTPANQRTIAALGINPERISTDELDRLKSTVTDTRGQALLGYLAKYQQAKTDLANSNQAIAESQANYLKQIADYNKGLVDSIVSLNTKLVNSSISMRNSIASLQQQVEEQALDIDKTQAQSIFTRQKTRLQEAYNKFLEKLGISTGDAFEQLFAGYDRVFELIDQINQRRFADRQNSITATYRQTGNETRKYQADREQQQSIVEMQRQNIENQKSNPLNQLGTGSSVPNNSSSSNSNLQLYRSSSSGLIVPVAGATNSRGGGYKEDTGLDIMTPIGSKVVASASGTLEYAEEGHSRQIGEDVDPTTPGFQKQKSIRIKLDKPLEYQGKKYYYQYYTHLRNIDPSIFNKGTHSRTPGTQQPIRIEAGQFLGETGTAGGGPHLHTGFSADREQREFLNYQQVSDVLFGTKNTSRNAVGKVIPVGQTIAQSSPPASQLENNNRNYPATSPDTKVMASTYTPGGGGMNGALKDSRGRRLSPGDYAIAIPAQNRIADQIPYGSVVKLKYGDRSVNAKVVDGGPYVPGRQLDMTTAAAKALKFNGVGEVGVQLVSLPSGADPSKKYYFGEATYKPKFGRGGSVSVAEANKAIGSVVRGDKYVQLSPTSQPTSQPQSVPTGEAIKNNIYQQGVNEQIDANIKQSNQYVGEINRLSDRDSAQTQNQRYAQQELKNAQDAGDRVQMRSQILQTQNQFTRQKQEFDRQTGQLRREAAAYNRSADRSPYRPLESLYQRYGGTLDSSILDPSITEGQSTIERAREEARSRRENLLKQIQTISAGGAGWQAKRSEGLKEVARLRKSGQTEEADRVADLIAQTDRTMGTPQARQATIDRLSREYRTLPSDGVAVYRSIAPSSSQSLSNLRQLNSQYLPRSFDDNLNAEARGIVERYTALKRDFQSRLSELDAAIAILEREIKDKAAAAGIKNLKIDLTNPETLAQMRSIAPEETANLEQATARRKQLNLGSQKVDRDAAAASDRAVAIGNLRQQIEASKARTDYLATTQPGNLFAQIEIDRARYQTGKQELDLQLQDGSIGVDLYIEKLKALKVSTDTLRNSLEPLRDTTTGFFNDIFQGQGVFDGLGGAIRNLTVNILKNFQDLIARQLGQQLFGSLLAGANDLKDNAEGGSQDIFSRMYRSISGGLGFSSPASNIGRSGYEGYSGYGGAFSLTRSMYDFIQPDQGKRGGTLGSLDIGLNSPIIPASPKQQPGLGDGLLKAGLGIGLQLLGIPAFANGGMVSSPTVALVGEGVHNEAIVPLPNGRSIPVDLRGDSGSSSNSNISSSVSVTIQNNGTAREISRGDANSLSQQVKASTIATIQEMQRNGQI